MNPLHAGDGRLRHPSARPARAYFRGGGGERRGWASTWCRDGSDRPLPRALPADPPWALPPVAALPKMIEGEDGGRHHPHLRLRQHDRPASSIDKKMRKPPYRGHGSPCPFRKNKAGSP